MKARHFVENKEKYILVLSHLILSRHFKIVKLRMTPQRCWSHYCSWGTVTTSKWGKGHDWRVIAREPPPILSTPHLVHFAIIHLLVTVYSHVIHPKEKQQLSRSCRPRLPCFIQKPTQVRGYMLREDHPPTSLTESPIVHPRKKYP